MFLYTFKVKSSKGREHDRQILVYAHTVHHAWQSAFLRVISKDCSDVDSICFRSEVACEENEK